MDFLFNRTQEPLVRLALFVRDQIANLTVIECCLNLVEVFIQ